MKTYQLFSRGFNKIGKHLYFCLKKHQGRLFIFKNQPSLIEVKLTQGNRQNNLIIFLESEFVTSIFKRHNDQKLHFSIKKK